MTMRPLFPILCLALFSTALSSRLRSFHINTTTELQWTPAQQYCKEKGDTPATVYNDEDACEIWEIIKRGLWLSLHRAVNSTRWANGDLVTFNNSSVPVLNGTQQCGAIDNTAWVNVNCTDKKPFMCYTNNKTSILIKENKTWCEAQRYCTKYHTNLVSIRDDIENDHVIKKGMDSPAPFWIGLLHDEWQWDDGRCSAFRDWGDTTMPINVQQSCTFFHKSYGIIKTIKTDRCDQEKSPLCSKGKVRIRLVNKSMTWETAWNYCDDNFDGPLRIESAEDRKLVEPMLKCAFSSVSVTGPVWMGLFQSRLLGFWMWPNGKIVDLGYSNWEGVNQPELPLSNHCGAISNEPNYTWSDQDCHSKRPFICEELLD